MAVDIFSGEYSATDWSRGAGIISEREGRRRLMPHPEPGPRPARRRRRKKRGWGTTPISERPPHTAPAPTPAPPAASAPAPAAPPTVLAPEAPKPGGRWKWLLAIGAAVGLALAARKSGE